ncbi:MAG: phosphoribosylformylglycinamidine cyclo-ligase [Chthonomonas sp.]|nr:phosphoribosylformylglycinamidine cyclo-ligase [Chthonomonas sp.]
MADQSLTYQDAGVNIDGAAVVLRSVSETLRKTHNDSVIGGIGGFGALFQPDFSDMARPVLVSSIDGVGTKTKVAAMLGKFDGLGADIVNHCVNDILCQGARPLFFLDYFGCSHLNAEQFGDVLRSAADACSAVGCALIGGETAELPGVYVDDEIDIVGSIVGVVDYEKKLPRAKMQAGDAVVGIASSGLHTNGYSLARRALFDSAGISARDEIAGLGTTVGEELLRPHRCYFNAVYPILSEVPEVYAAAHVTGGGFYDNIPRILPTDCRVIIDRRSWTPLPIFQMIQEAGNIETAEMYRVFNMGVGMVLICSREVAPSVVQRLSQEGENAAIIGEVQKGPNDVQIM